MEIKKKYIQICLYLNTGNFFFVLFYFYFYFLLGKYNDDEKIQFIDESTVTLSWKLRQKKERKIDKAKQKKLKN